MSRRALASLAALALLVPAFAAADPAVCCKGMAQARVSHGCCRPQVQPTAQPRGCCNVPDPARSDTATAAPVSLACAGVERPTLSAGQRVHIDLRPLALLQARWDHRAPSPDDSPPDRLAKNVSLLI
jgi:hypothetical protein